MHIPIHRSPTLRLEYSDISDSIGQHFMVIQQTSRDGADVASLGL